MEKKIFTNTKIHRWVFYRMENRFTIQKPTNGCGAVSAQRLGSVSAGGLAAIAGVGK